MRTRLFAILISMAVFVSLFPLGINTAHADHGLCYETIEITRVEIQNFGLDYGRVVVHVRVSAQHANQALRVNVRFDSALPQTWTMVYVTPDEYFDVPSNDFTWTDIRFVVPLSHFPTAIIAVNYRAQAWVYEGVGGLPHSGTRCGRGSPEYIFVMPGINLPYP